MELLPDTLAWGLLALNPNVHRSASFESGFMALGWKSAGHSVDLQSCAFTNVWIIIFFFSPTQEYKPYMFWMNMIDAFYQSLVCFFIPYFVSLLSSSLCHRLSCSVCVWKVAWWASFVLLCRHMPTPMWTSLPGVLLLLHSPSSPSCCIWASKPKPGWEIEWYNILVVLLKRQNPFILTKESNTRI